MKKTVTWLILPLLAASMLYAFQVPLWQRYMHIDTHFDPHAIPAPPDYSKPAHWAALPDRKDTADLVPPESGFADEQDIAQVDVFFVHPTNSVLSRRINAPVDDPITNYVTDHGSIIQHASAFNGAGRIYAPRYREVTMAAQQSQISGQDKDAARGLALGDVVAAFEYYMAHYNHGRPVIIASHSQGSWYTPELLRRYFARGKPYERQLVAAYVVGARLDEATARTIDLPLCAEPGQTHCYASWDSVLENGELAGKPIDPATGKNLCVNPLSWRTDRQAIDRKANGGSLGMVGLTGLPPLIPQVFGARCGDNGLLLVNDSDQPGFARVRFAGGWMHTYDYGLFYASVHENARLRAQRWLEGQ